MKRLYLIFSIFAFFPLVCFGEGVSMVRQPLILGDMVEIVPTPIITNKRFPINAIEAIGYPTRPPKGVGAELGLDCNLVSLAGIIVTANLEDEGNQFRIVIDLTSAKKELGKVSLQTVYELLLVCLKLELSPTLVYRFEIETRVDYKANPGFKAYNGPLWIGKTVTE